jgi:hypothetical protein
MARNKNRNFLFKDASGSSFRNQAGSTYWYDAGVAAAEAAFAQGGVNGLLAFLAGFNASDYQQEYTGLNDLLDDLN